MPDLPDLTLAGAGAFTRAAGLELGETSGERVSGFIDAGPDHHTPWGIVHGGVYAAAVESACSVGASVAVAERGQVAVGVTNHTEFLRAHRSGRLTVEARPIHQGRTGQVWECDVRRADGALVARGTLRLQHIDAA